MTSSIGYNDCVLGKDGTLRIALRRHEGSRGYELFEIKELAEQFLSSSKAHQSQQDADKKGEARQRGEDGLVLSSLHRTVVIDDGVTLRDFFKMLTRYQILQQVNMLILPFMEEFENAPLSGCALPDVKQLLYELYVTVDWEGNLKREHVFHGDYGKPLDTPPFNRTFLLDCCPLDSLLDLPLAISRVCVVTICPKGRDYREEGVHPVKHEALFRGPSLLDFVYAITDELAEYGSPEGRERFRGNLGNMIERLEEGEEAEE